MDTTETIETIDFTEVADLSEEILLLKQLIAETGTHILEMPDSDVKDMEVKNLGHYVTMLSTLVEKFNVIHETEASVARSDKELELKKEQFEKENTFKMQQMNLEIQKLQNQIKTDRFNIVINALNATSQICSAGSKIGYMGAMFKAEYKDDKIISSKTSGLLGK